ncbi:MAG: hypothetical protein ACRDDI_17620 [Aeromonas veronii]
MAEKLSKYLNTKGCCGILFYCLQQALQDVDERTLSDTRHLPLQQQAYRAPIDEAKGGKGLHRSEELCAITERGRNEDKNSQVNGRSTRNSARGSAPKAKYRP